MTGDHKKFTDLEELGLAPPPLLTLPLSPLCLCTVAGPSLPDLRRGELGAGVVWVGGLSAAVSYPLSLAERCRLVGCRLFISISLIMMNESRSRTIRNIFANFRAYLVRLEYQCYQL